MIVVLMGVTWSGKTTVGKVLAKQLRWSRHHRHQRRNSVRQL